MLQVSQPVSSALALAMSHVHLVLTHLLVFFSQYSDCFKIRKKVSENNASKSMPFIPLSSFRSHCITAVYRSLVSGALYCSI